MEEEQEISEELDWICGNCKTWACHKPNSNWGDCGSVNKVNSFMKIMKNGYKIMPVLTTNRNHYCSEFEVI